MTSVYTNRELGPHSKLYHRYELSSDGSVGYLRVHIYHMYAFYTCHIAIIGIKVDRIGDTLITSSIIILIDPFSVCVTIFI
jgi:hypothetical protein